LNLKDANDVEVGAELDTPTKGDVDSSTYQLEPGTYTVFCKVVGHANMVATLIVK
jgi:plastocyanin